MDKKLPKGAFAEAAKQMRGVRRNGEIAEEAKTSLKTMAEGADKMLQSLGFEEDHTVGSSREGGSIKRSHRAEGRNWVD